MITWVLILLVIGNNNTPAISTVPGFTTETECQTAGRAVQASPDPISRFGKHSVIFACVQQTKK